MMHPVFTRQDYLLQHLMHQKALFEPWLKTRDLIPMPKTTTVLLHSTLLQSLAISRWQVFFANGVRIIW
ncbi:hypothetical protein BVZ27_29155 [Klebsiella pneumoniae]|nr:hypothetical protein BVZ27_29155 [Klebsiella pneumoniae]